MEFGKVGNLSEIDFSMPNDHAQTDYLLGLLQAERPLSLRLGTPAWGCTDWVGKIYPPKTKPADFLKYYAQQFSTIELNTTHYRTPDPATIARWKESVPAHFRFCPKIPQAISHRRHLDQAYDETMRFCDAVLGLGEQLGPCFMQLPPHFSPDKAEELMVFMKMFPKNVRLALEFRHEAWFLGNEAAEDMWAMMQSEGIGSVITDVAGRRDVLHQRLTAPWPLIRLVGNSLHPSDFARVDAWMQRLAQWKKVGEVYLFLHQPEELLCPEMADYMIRAANKTLQAGLAPLKFYNVQQSLF